LGYNTRGHLAKQYVESSHKLFNNPMAFSKIRPNGEILKYDLKYNTFGAFTKDGVPKTMFKPRLGIEYWIKRN